MKPLPLLVLASAVLCARAADLSLIPWPVKLDQNRDRAYQRDLYGRRRFGRRMAGEHQVKKRDTHHYERNRVHERSSTAHPEQARAKEQGGNIHHGVGEQQSEVNSVYNHDQN